MTTLNLEQMEKNKKEIREWELVRAERRAREAQNQAKINAIKAQFEALSDEDKRQAKLVRMIPMRGYKVNRTTNQTNMQTLDKHANHTFSNDCAECMRGHKDNGHGYCTVKDCTIIHQTGEPCRKGCNYDVLGWHDNNRDCIPF